MLSWIDARYALQQVHHNQCDMQRLRDPFRGVGSQSADEVVKNTQRLHVALHCAHIDPQSYQIVTPFKAQVYAVHAATWSHMLSASLSNPRPFGPEVGGSHVLHWHPHEYNMNTHTYTHTHIHACMHTFTLHACIYMHTCICTVVLSCKLHRHLCMCIYIYVYTSGHIYIYTYVYIYIYYVFICVCVWILAKAKSAAVTAHATASLCSLQYQALQCCSELPETLT